MGIVGITSDGRYAIGGSMDDVFRMSWGADYQNNIERIKGNTGNVGINTPGAMNAYYGPQIQNIAYNQKNTLAAIGQKAYKTGYRFQTDLSLGEEDTTGLVRGGNASKPTFGKYLQCEMPYKLMAKRQAMELGYVDIGAKSIDDVTSWENFFALEGKTWAWSMNVDLLRPVDTDRKVGLGTAVGGGVESADPRAGEYVGLESIDRIISNFAEGGFINGGKADDVKNVPWAMNPQMPSTDSSAPLAKYRNPAVAGAEAENNFNCYVDANYTAGSTDGTATTRQLTLEMVDAMMMECMPYWEANDVTGCVMSTGYTTTQHLQTLLQPQQRYIGQIGVQFDVNGIKTVPGRETGFMVASYNGVPILPDRSIKGGTKENHSAGAQDIFLINRNILSYGTLVAPQVTVSDNTIINGTYTRLADMYQLGEIQVDGMFKGLGKIKHLK